MSRILASLCNLPQSAMSGLVLADFSTGESRLLDLGMPEKIKTCTGLALGGERVYAVGVTAAEVHYLAVLAADTLATLYTCRLSNVRDVHSILVDDAALYLVSTGTDTVIRYDLSPEGLSNPAVAWQASGEGRDTHHINSIALWNGDVVISAFGPKTGATWSTATGGYIHNLTQNLRVAEGIYQPHSLCAANGELYYCESARGRIYAANGGCLEVGGYVRGLAFSPTGQFAVGTSVARKVSKSSGIVNNPGDPGEPTGKCELAVCTLNTDGPKRLAELSLAAYGSEIYEVVVLDWPEAVIAGQESNLPEIRSVPRQTEDNQHLAQVQAFSELHYQIGTLTRELEAAREESDLNDAEIELLQDRQRQAEKRIAEQEDRISSLTGQAEAMAEELADARHRLNAILSSTSWKAMAPLRRLIEWMRKF